MHARARSPEWSVEDCERSIARRFEAVAAAAPRSVALRSAGRTTTYRDLDAQADRIAHAVLGACGAGDETTGVLLAKEPALVAALLGCFKAGKIYVPIDPAHPAERSRFILEDSGAAVVVTDGAHATQARGFGRPGLRVLLVDDLPPGDPAGPPSVPVDGDTPATLLYTSGSTGRPKGVLQNHRNTAFNTRNASRSVGITVADRVALVQSGSVHGGVRDSLTALMNGARLALHDLATAGVGPMAEWIRSEELTFVNMVVTVFRHFVATLGPEDRFPSVRALKSGSEALTAADVAAFRRHFPARCVLWSGFGATETGNNTQLLVDEATALPDGAVPLGRPLPGMEVLVVDEAGRPVPADTVGEVVIRSRYLALGYWNRPDQTDRVFRPDPDGGDRRLYMTGDLGRLGPDGDLQLLGRRDAMVKVRGQRVELGEVEQALLGLPGIKQAAVVASDRAPGDTRLCAYVVALASPGPGAGEIRRALQALLPVHMVPDRVMTLPILPATAQGKIDRRALPRPDWTRVERTEPVVPPRTPIERELAAIWRETLGLDELSVTDRFLDLGGHSLQAGDLGRRVLDRYRLELTLPSLLEAETIADMATRIVATLAADSVDTRVARLLESLDP
jgi:amino acid adenylation domain-containing protein